jgi:hypothetical protein
MTKTTQQKKKTEYVTEFLRGTIDFASVHSPKNKYGKENSKFPNDKEYSLTMRMDNEETLKSFKDLLKKHNAPLQVKNPQTLTMVDRIRPDKNGVLKVQFKTSYVDHNGLEKELQVIDKNKKPIPKETLIGNGSEAIVAITFSKDPTTKETKSIFLAGLQVINLKKYNGPEFSVISEGSNESSEDELQSASPF